MKKYTLIIICIILLLTGCKKTPITKNIECTLNNEVEGIKVNGKYEVIYTDKYVDKIILTEKYTVEKDYLIESIENTFDSLYQEGNNLKHYEYTRQTDGLTITSIVKLDYNKINIEALQKTNLPFKNTIKDGKVEANTLINSYKTNGAICKEINQN